MKNSSNKAISIVKLYGRVYPVWRNQIW